MRIIDYIFGRFVIEKYVCICVYVADLFWEKFNLSVILSGKMISAETSSFPNGIIYFSAFYTSFIISFFSNIRKKIIKYL